MRLGQVLKRWRLMSELDLRTAAKQMGIDGAATLLRIEQGRGPSAKTLGKIIAWLLSEGDSQ